jgi:hypothetical protein
MLVAWILYGVAGLFFVLYVVNRNNPAKVLACKTWLRIAIIFVVIGTANTLFNT